MKQIAYVMLPPQLGAQYGPCDLLMNIMIEKGAIAAELYSLYYGLNDLCKEAIIASEEAAVVLCADADLALFQAQNVETDAVLAEGDYTICYADFLAGGLGLAVGATSDDDWSCSTYDDWMYSMSDDTWTWESVSHCTHDAAM